MKKNKILLVGSLLVATLIWWGCEKVEEFNHDDIEQDNLSEPNRTAGGTPEESMALATYQTQLEINALDEESWDNYFSIYLNPGLTDEDKFVMLDADPAYDNLISSFSNQLNIMIANPSIFDTEDDIDIYSDLVGDLYNDHAPYLDPCTGFKNLVSDIRADYAICVIAAAIVGAETFGVGLIGIAACWGIYTRQMNSAMRDYPDCIHTLEGIWTDIRILSLEAQEFHESGGVE